MKDENKIEIEIEVIERYKSLDAGSQKYVLGYMLGRIQRLEEIEEFIETQKTA